MKQLLKRIIQLGLLLIAGILLSYYIVVWSTSSRIYSDIESIPKNKVGLLLGTSKTLSNGWANKYYDYRLRAAVELYRAEKIDYILVSGDNGTRQYDEPTDFKKDLVAAGVPEDRIYLDYAGFRTLDSVVRCKEVFGQESVTVISQHFHNERALFLARAKGVDAVAYDAQDVSKKYGVKVQLREYLARVKMMIDLITFKEPKFLGDKVAIG